jgi:ADP-heptose:LPS heptosyltransferase
MVSPAGVEVSSRFPARVRVLFKATAKRFLSLQRRAYPAEPRKILVVPTILIGDTLLVTPLLAKLRERYPQADVVMTVRRELMPLYASRPYGVTAVSYDPRDPSTVEALSQQGDFDLALVPGDNRHSWLAAAADARWIVAHAGDRPAYKSWPVDDLIPYPDTPAAWGDMVAQLIDGPPPAPYDPADWRAPDCAQFDLPTRPYAVLHVGASSPLRLWQPQRWRALAEWLSERGFAVVWSGGRGEDKIAATIDPDGRYASYAGKLDLPQLWHLLRNAALLVCPDTGVAHLGRLTNTPTVTLFGPGSAVLFGAGEFWRESPFRAVTLDNYPCRDQRTLFKREIAWVRRCQRTLKECPRATCMEALNFESVKSAAEQLLRSPRAVSVDG